MGWNPPFTLVKVSLLKVSQNAAIQEYYILLFILFNYADLNPILYCSTMMRLFLLLYVASVCFYKDNIITKSTDTSRRKEDASFFPFLAPSKAFQFLSSHHHHLREM